MAQIWRSRLDLDNMENNKTHRDEEGWQGLGNQTSVVVDNIFAYNVALDIISENENSVSKSIKEYR